MGRRMNTISVLCRIGHTHSYRVLPAHVQSCRKPLAWPSTTLSGCLGRKAFCRNLPLVPCLLGSQSLSNHFNPSVTQRKPQTHQSDLMTTNQRVLKLKVGVLPFETMLVSPILNLALVLLSFPTTDENNIICASIWSPKNIASISNICARFRVLVQVHVENSKWTCPPNTAAIRFSRSIYIDASE